MKISDKWETQADEISEFLEEGGSKSTHSALVITKQKLESRESRMTRDHRVFHEMGRCCLQAVYLLLGGEVH